MKSALAPMFAVRALELRSWASVNLLGGGDGATLADPETARSKTVAKRSGLDAMVGHAGARARCTSTRSRTSASGRPRGTTCASTGSSAPG